jgi:levanbiose-producing levanase
MNNWAYAGAFPTEDWHGGSDSLVRTITLRDDDGRATLHSSPAPELDAVSGDPETLDDVRLADGETVDITVPASGAYRLRLDAASPAGELRVKVLTGDGSFATVGYDFAARSVFVARDADAVAGTMPDAYREVRTAAVEPVGGRITLDIVVDAASIEVFAGDGRAALTMATFGTAGARGLQLEGAREAVAVTGASLTPLRVAPVERESSRG